MERAIWWIRRDLRLLDNQALAAAMEQAQQIIPLFILDPVLLEKSKVSGKRLSFLFSGLQELDNHLRKIGSRLVIRRGKPVEVLYQLTKGENAGAVFAEADFTPYARRRDAEVAASVPIHLVGSPGLRHPADVVKEDGSPYTVFTPYMRAWKKGDLPGRMNLINAPERIDSPASVVGDPVNLLEEHSSPIDYIPGEEEANKRLECFTAVTSGDIYSYSEKRNRMDMEATSGLSPYLRFGMVSPRQAVIAAREAGQMALDREAENSTDTWMNEIIWRDFYISILYHYPHVLQMSFRPEYRQIQWKNDGVAISAWESGMTGYPVVDAGMRQLSATGWMHNRARMITASFLVKDLLVDWRQGEAHFMRQLLDGDMAVNNGSWQWTAGTGTDAAPYFRIFNPILQGQKFDPQGNYIRQWVSELQGVPTEYIHAPWLMPATQQVRSGCIMGKDYPKPIVDHRLQRELILGLYSRK